MLHSWDSDSSSSDRTPTCERVEDVSPDATPPTLRIQRSGSGWWDEPRTPTSAASFDESRLASLQATPSSVATDAASDTCATSGSSALSSPQRPVSNWRIEQILDDDEADVPPPPAPPPLPSSSPTLTAPLRKTPTGWWNVDARPVRRAAHISWTRPPPPTFNSRVFLPQTVDAMVRYRPRPRCVSWNGA
ncbi:hypothetical protein AURDEDRAFT_113343 [Auricularia subglabra TFB-10046 SS5]|nr:hypothetical protein AURDEDRAFT_113343 [Auricularia subglabra TFB-10046 SS5]